MGQNSYRCRECGEYKWCGDCIPTICPECECKAKGHLAIIGTDGVVCARMMTPDAAAELVRRANAYPRLVAALEELERLATELLSAPVKGGLTNHQAAVRGVAIMFREKITAALADE